MSKKGSKYRHEGRILGTYLLGERPNESAVETYHTILSAGDNATNRRDKLASYAIAHPWSIPLLDSAAALIRPHSELRRRLQIMFAVLESRPEYSEWFLSKHYPKLYIVVIGLTGIKAVVKAVCGIVLIKALRI